MVGPVPRELRRDQGRARAFGLVAALAWLVACGDEGVGLRLVRVPTVGECGAWSQVTALRVRALGDFPITDQSAVTLAPDAGRMVIGSFPAQIAAVSVEGLAGGPTPVVAGRSAAFDFDALVDGQDIPIFVGPLDGACSVQAMESPRVAPQIARLGSGALVLGGENDDGAVTLVERFDAATGAFVTLPSDHYGTSARGFSGTSLTAVASGAVAIGGPVTAWQLWDEDGTTSGPNFLPEARARHAAVALDGRRILVAGGCAQIEDDGACAAGSQLRTSSILDAVDGSLVPGPRLSFDRIDGAAFLDPDGTIILAGGVDEGGAPVPAERVDLAGDQSVAIGGAGGGSTAQLASGSVLVGLGTRDVPAASFELAPSGANEVVALPAGTPRAGARFVPTEDGSVIIVGGDAAASRWNPLSATAAAIEPGLTSTLTEPATLLLGDGSILIVGGRDGDGQASAQAQLMRPPLLGPLDNADVVVRFGDLAASSSWVPRDPSRHARVSGAIDVLEIESPQDGTTEPGELGVIAGPALASAVITATLGAEAGFAVLLGRGSSGAWTVILRPGELAQVVDDQGSALSGCGDAEVVATADLGSLDEPVALAVEATSSELVVRSGARRLLRCQGLGEPPRGFVGLGVLGPAGSRLRIDTVSVTRRLP